MVYVVYANSEAAKMADEDMKVIIYGVLLAITYVVAFLGSYSPIHCRLTVTAAGLASIGISIFAGFGLAFLMGWKED